MKIVIDNWQRSFFSGVANQFWDAAVEAEQTRSECDFLCRHFTPGSELLDIPSGSGRIASVMLQRGYSVTAVDLSKENIDKLKRNCDCPHLTAVVGDMTEYTQPDKFFGAYCLGNSFNYLDYLQLKKYLGNISASLKKNSLFIIHSGAMAESLLLNLEERTWYNAAGLTATLEHRYHPLQSLLETEYTFIDSIGERSRKRIYHHVYTLAETNRLLAGCGLKLCEIYSDTGDSEYTVGCPECYLIATKK